MRSPRPAAQDSRWAYRSKSVGIFKEAVPLQIGLFVCFRKTPTPSEIDTIFVFEAKDIKRDLIPAFNALNQILVNKIAKQSKESEKYCPAIFSSKEHPSSTEASEDVQKYIV